MRARIAVVLGCATLLASIAAGQGDQFQSRIYPPNAIRGTKGLPYSVERIAETWQILADGTRISRPTITTKMFRDSVGRIREEQPMMIRNEARAEAIVELYDVVAGYRYILDPVNKVAHRSAIPPLPQRPGMTGGVIGSPGVLAKGSTSAQAATRPAAPKAAGSLPRIDTTSESLGTQVIEGLTCEGKKETITYPIGISGNDRPLTTINETWMSTELKITVLSKYEDLLRGNRSVQLKNISRTEPEYSLFQPPPDYKIVDETGSFDLVINLP